MTTSKKLRLVFGILLVLSVVGYVFANANSAPLCGVSGGYENCTEYDYSVPELYAITATITFAAALLVTIFVKKIKLLSILLTCIVFAGAMFCFFGAYRTSTIRGSYYEGDDVYYPENCPTCGYIN